MILDFEDFKIITDERQYIVQKKKVIQAHKFTNPENVGKEVCEDIAYCSTLDFALKFLSNRVVLENDDLRVIKDKLTLLDDKITEFIRLLSLGVEQDG